MNNVVELQVLVEKIVLRIPHANIVQEIDNIASFDSRTKKVISTGTTQEEFQKNFPRKWKKYKGNLEFAPIFDVQAFRSEAAGLFLWGWLNAMINQVVGNIVFRVQTKLELNIVFENYEHIPLKKQQEFEFLVFRYLSARKMTVNGKEKAWDQRSIWPSRLLVTLNFIFAMVFLLFSIFPIMFLATWVPANNFPLFLELFLIGVGSLGSMTVLVYLGNSISILLWVLFLKPFIHTEVLAMALKYQYNMPVRQNTDKITNFFINWIIKDRA